MHTTRALMFAAALGLTIAGCKGKKTDATDPAATPNPGSATVPAIVDDGLPPVVPIDEAAVRTMVDAWLAAQNRGDFAAYQALYADKMEGVKRVGARTWRFDRKGWLDDRGRMFKNPMVVAAKDLVIRGSASAPSVQLVQSFQQGKFADEGTKALALIKTPAGFRIAREEMLASVVAGGVAVGGTGAVYLIVAVDDKLRVVIKDHAELAWGKGFISGPHTGAHDYAMQNASSAPGAANWQGRALAVYDADGTRCEASVGALHLLSGGTPHFGEVQGWNNEYGAGDGHVWSKPERARALFDMTTPYLVGDLAITGDCQPLFAMDPAAQPSLLAASADDPKLDAAARAAFMKLPSYGQLQTNFTDSGGTGVWAPSDAIGVVAYGKYVVVSAREGEGCAEFLGELVAIYERRGGDLVLLSRPEDGYFSVAAMVDADGDGKPELIGSYSDFRTVTSLITLDAAGNFVPTAKVEFPYNDCGC